MKIIREYRGLFLLVTVVLMVVMNPLWATYGGRGRILLMLGFIIAVGFGGYLMAGKRHWLILFSVLVFLSAALAGIELSYGPSLACIVAIEIVSFVIYGATIAVALRFALFGRDVHPLDRVLGGITGYFLLGLAWVHIYTLILAVDPAAIHAVGESGIAERGELLYFSFITLTTQGYGEIVPVNPYARMAASMEGVVGTLYVAILIASLVSELRSSRSSKPVT